MRIPHIFIVLLERIKPFRIITHTRFIVPTGEIDSQLTVISIIRIVYVIFTFDRRIVTSIRFRVSIKLVCFRIHPVFTGNTRVIILILNEQIRLQCYNIKSELCLLRISITPIVLIQSILNRPDHFRISLIVFIEQSSIVFLQSITGGRILYQQIKCRCCIGEVVCFSKGFVSTCQIHFP